MKTSITLNVLWFMVPVLWSGTAYAQSPWQNDNPSHSIMIDWDKPTFDTDFFDRDLIRSASSVLFVKGRFKIREGFRTVVEVPLSHFSYKESALTDKLSHTSIGNLYLGVELDLTPRNQENKPYLEFGIRIPTMAYPDSPDKIGYLTGLLSENDRKEAFLPDVWSVPLIINDFIPLDGSFTVGFRVGGIYDIYAGDFSDQLDNELHLIYGLTALLRNPGFMAHLGVAARNHVTGNDPDLYESGLTQLRGGFSVPLRSAEPGLFVRLPLGDNYGDVINWAYGISLKLHLQ